MKSLGVPTVAKRSAADGRLGKKIDNFLPIELGRSTVFQNGATSLVALLVGDDRAPAFT
jgi:hypothetical protein